MTTQELETSLPPLCRGARVRMSPLGRARHPKYGDREGLIVGQGSPSSWRVKFDDRKTIQAIHQDYLERVPRSTRRRRPSAAGGRALRRLKSVACSLARPGRAMHSSRRPLPSPAGASR